MLGCRLTNKVMRCSVCVVDHAVDEKPKLCKTPPGGREAVLNGHFAKFGFSSTGIYASSLKSCYYVCNWQTLEIGCLHLDACITLPLASEKESVCTCTDNSMCHAQQRLVRVCVVLPLALGQYFQNNTNLIPR